MIICVNFDKTYKKFIRLSMWTVQKYLTWTAWYLYFGELLEQYNGKTKEV